MFKHKPFKTWFIVAVIVVVLGVVINVVAQTTLKQFLNLVLDSGKPIYDQSEDAIKPMYLPDAASKTEA
ncbi:hypothetical protein J6Y73_03195, partial [bacterium]|nr:hypothetical protein [bacterium]